MPSTLQILGGRSLVDLESVPVRTEIQFRHSRHLPRRRHLDRDAILNPSRRFTQKLGRLLYQDGFAGILYGSKLRGLCLAIFERRARLLPAGSPEPLTDSIPDLEQVCRDLGLTLL